MPQPTLHNLALEYLNERRQGREVCHRASQGQRSVILSFCRFVGEVDTADIAGKDVTGFLNSRRITASTWRSYDSTLRSWVRWMLRNGHLHHDPLAGLRRPRRPRTTPRGLPADAVRRLLDHVDGDTRATLMVTLMVQQGLRCIEVSRAGETAMKKLPLGVLALSLALAGCAAADKPLPAGSDKFPSPTVTTVAAGVVEEAAAPVTTVTTAKPVVAAAKPCDVVREALLTGTQADIDASMAQLVADKTADATAREYADYYLHRDAGEPSMREMDVSLIRMSCS